MFCNKTDSRRTMGRPVDNTLEGDDNRNNNRPSFSSPRARSRIPTRKPRVTSGTNARKGKSLITQELKSKKDRPRVKAPPAKSRTSQGIETKAMHPSVSTQRTSNDECIGRRWSGCAATFPIQMLPTNPEEKDLTGNLSYHFWIPYCDLPEPQDIVVEASDGTRFVITHPPTTSPENCSRTSAKNEDSNRNVSHQSAYHARLPRSTLESIPSGKVLDTSSPSPSQPLDSILISEPCVATPSEIANVQDVPLLDPAMQHRIPSSNTTYTVSNVSSHDWDSKRSCKRSILIPRHPKTYEEIYNKKKALERSHGMIRFGHDHDTRTADNEAAALTFQAKGTRMATVTDTRHEYEDAGEESDHSNVTVVKIAPTKANRLDTSFSPEGPSHSTGRVPTEMDVMYDRCCGTSETLFTCLRDPVIIPTTVDVCVMTDYLNPNTDMEPKDCPNCKLFQTMLSQSESNRSYVTEFLAESNIVSTGVEPRTVDPLALKAFVESTAQKELSIPSFDMENFLKQYIQTALVNEDLSKSPFSPNQLFHIALAARDAMAQAVLHELGTAERVLKGRYNFLVSLSESGPVRESEFWQIIDGYRRFVRYMYHFYNESMKKLQAYEETYLSKENRGSEEEVALGMIYSTSQTVTIDGVEYDAVVIPVQKKEVL